MNKLAFIYPGQGAQKVGMGKDFYDNSACAKEIFTKADDILDIEVTKTCFEENDKLDSTAYTQPCLVTTCLAITKELNERGIYPDVTAGLSLGEYAAIAAAGAISYKDAIKCVRKRGIYMEEAVPSGKGAMAAVLGMETEDIENVIAPIDGVTIANYNCPGQIVITGKKAAVEEGMEKLKEAGAKRCLMLNVSGPFHSPFLKEAGQKLGNVLDNIEITSLKVPYVANVNASYVEDCTQIKDLLINQVYSSVRWQQSVEKMIDNGVDTFVEIGPGKTLAGFIKKINKEVTVLNISNMEDIGELLCYMEK
ncbi:MAG: ACP S-malonyltransferase [Clostridiales bacterium]|nr:ACP S-malonyltransferase [Clostridiales bacterium]